MAQGRSTIGDVARRAGVSPTAVSRSLNGVIRLPPTTAGRIRKAATELGYHPHAQARSLSTGRAFAIGIIVPEIANPFFSMLAGAAEMIAVDAGYDVVIWSTRNVPEREHACFARLTSGYVDGVLLITNHADDGRLAREVKAASGRVVIVDEDVRGTRVPKIFVQNTTGGMLATRHLIERGHRRIGHIGGPAGVMSAIERAEGWRRGLSEAGLKPRSAWHICSEYEIAASRVDAGKLLDGDPELTAIFAGSDASALGVMYAARDRGLRIPDDLSLVGFDGMALGELLGPPLTSIVQPIAQLGTLAAENLMAMIAGPAERRKDDIVSRLDVRLEKRGSVAAPRQDGIDRSTNKAVRSNKIDGRHPRPPR